MKTTSERGGKPSPFNTFTREEWAALRDATPLPLTEAEIEQLRGLNDRISLEEVSEVYLPLSRLLNMFVAASQRLHSASGAFLGNSTERVPYIIGIAGSVAVGKSTTARVLQALLARWPNHPKVDLVTTDGFLFPNAVLEERGLMHRKGFPESYDIRSLLRFLIDLKSGSPEVRCPVYSHLAYDIIPGEMQAVRQPDILILEGLNVLQTTRIDGDRPMPELFVSDFFDFSIYVDADEANIAKWYLERIAMLQETAFQNPSSYFHQRFAGLTPEELAARGSEIWRDINLANLRANIMPTRGRAKLILHKGADHAVEKVRLRKL